MKPTLKNLQRIHDLAMKLKSSGLDLDTVTCTGYKLSQIDRKTDINDPLKVAKWISEKLNKPKLMKIELRNLRNYSGERFYKSLPIRDPFAVMQHFRHKCMKTTEHYLRAMIIEYSEDDQWISLITNSPEEECKAIEKGYQIVRAINENKAIYRKRK